MIVSETESQVLCNRCAHIQLIVHPHCVHHGKVMKYGLQMWLFGKYLGEIIRVLKK